MKIFAAGRWKRCARNCRVIETERSEYDRLMTSLEQLYKQGALAASEGTEAVFVEGAANLLTGEQDHQRLQDCCALWKKKKKWSSC